MGPYISVIIPIYNSQDVLKKCLDSLSGQSFENFEAIMIDDGSSDNSATICKAFCKVDNRFKYFSQENLGPSKARDNGIKKSEGEFIFFLDADDTIEQNTLERVIEVQNETQVDIVHFSYNYIMDGNISKRSSIIPKNEIIDKSKFMDILKKDHPDKKQLLWFSWLNLIRKSLIIDNNITHDYDLRIGVDSTFNLRCFLSANRIFALEDALYNYHFNSNSLTRRPYRPYFLQNTAIQLASKVAILKQFNLFNEPFLVDLARYYIQHTLGYLLTNEKNSPNGLTIMGLREIRESDVFHFCFNHYSPSNYISFKQKTLIALFKKKYYRLLRIILLLR